MIVTQVAMPFTASASGAASGLVGTIGVQVVNSDAVVVIDHTTADIIELVAGSGVYLWTASAAPATIGSYEVIWDNGDESFASEDMLVVAAPITTSGGSGAPPYPTIGTVRAQAQQTQRAVRGRAFVAEYAFGLDGDALPDADTAVNVTIVNAEGYVVVNDLAATLGEVADDEQTATFDLTPAVTPQRDAFTCMWVATIGGVSVTQVSTIDVCDARLFPLSDYAQYPELAARGFTAAEMEQARTDAEDRLEWECGCAFTGRYGSEAWRFDDRRGEAFDEFGTLWHWGRRGGVHHITLRRPFVQALRSITRTHTHDGTTTTTQLDLDHARLDSWSSTVDYHHRGHGLHGSLTIGYEHGQPVADVRRICAMLARHRLLHGPLDSRATQMAVEGGGTINLATPGMLGSVFGIPEIDVFVQRHNHRVTGFLSTNLS